jgi:hypothetical protein
MSKSGTTGISQIWAVPRTPVARALLWVDTQSNQVVLITTDKERDNDNRATRDPYRIASTNLFPATKAPLKTGDLPDELPSFAGYTCKACSLWAISLC